MLFPINKTAGENPHMIQCGCEGGGREGATTFTGQIGCARNTREFLFACLGAPGRGEYTLQSLHNEKFANPAKIN